MKSSPRHNVPRPGQGTRTCYWTHEWTSDLVCSIRAVCARDCNSVQPTLIAADRTMFVDINGNTQGPLVRRGRSWVTAVMDTSQFVRIVRRQGHVREVKDMTKNAHTKGCGTWESESCMRGTGRAGGSGHGALGSTPLFFGCFSPALSLATKSEHGAGFVMHWDWLGPFFF